jgi:glycosyltransferase involved in cell wall biosynthesis
MKIAFFVHCFFPGHFYGTETYTLELAKNYQKAGHDVNIVSAIFQGEKRSDGVISRYEYQGIPILCIDKNYLPHTRVKETYHQDSMRSTLGDVLRELAPDLIHVTHLVNHTATLLEVAKELSIPVYATFTDFFGFCLNNKLEAANGDLCKGPNASRTNCLACHFKAVTSNPGAPLWMHYGVNFIGPKTFARIVNLIRKLPPFRHGSIDGLAEDIACRPNILAVLYNSGYVAAVAPTKFLSGAYESNGIHIPLHHIQFGVDIDRSAKAHRSKDHIPVIGFIGQIAPHKGTDLLVEAFCRLPKDLATLRIYGPNDQSPTYMNELESCANGFDVSFMGTFPKEEMASVLKEIDLLVIPSRWYENSPLVLLNALATHTPVLVTDVAGMTEFVKPGINGFTFELGNVDHLFQQLLRILKGKNDLLRMTETTHYEKTIDSMSRETMKIYK